MNDLTVGGIISAGFQRGFKYVVPVVVNVILWILTIWIPYINLGTTIGLFVGLVVKMKNDEDLSMTEIFNSRYRKNMMGFFLASALVGLVVNGLLIIGAVPIVLTQIMSTFSSFMPIQALSSILVPLGILGGTFAIGGVVLAIALSLSVLLAVDKGMNATEAMKKSNEVTYGKKWAIFLGKLVLLLIVGVAIVILFWVFNMIGIGIVTFLVVGAAYAVAVTIMLGAQSYIYGTLTKE